MLNNNKFKCAVESALSSLCMQHVCSGEFSLDALVVLSQHGQCTLLNISKMLVHRGENTGTALSATEIIHNSEAPVKSEFAGNLEISDNNEHLQTRTNISHEKLSADIGTSHELYMTQEDPLSSIESTTEGHLSYTDYVHTPITDTTTSNEECSLNISNVISDNIQWEKQMNESENLLNPINIKPIVNYDCMVCDMCFDTEQQLVAHRSLRAHAYRSMLHNEAKRYKCSVCTAEFSQISALAQHCHTHDDTEMKMYRCSICNEEFTHMSLLIQHIHTHDTDIHTHDTEKRPYRCSICDANFAQMSLLDQHYSTHDTEKKMYRCRLCTVEFSQIGLLAQHYHTHANEKNKYRCNICNLVFDYMTSLTQHKHSHDKAKNKQKVFSIEEYKNTHKEDNLFQCPTCQKTFALHKSLIEHRRTGVPQKKVTPSQKKNDLAQLKINLFQRFKNRTDILIFREVMAVFCLRQG